MVSRVLTWQTLEAFGNKFNLGAFYMEGAYAAVAVRLKAEDAPDVEAAEFNIYADGVSIFSDSGSTLRNTLGTITASEVDTNIRLQKGDDENADAESFRPNLLIGEGSWITCNCIKDGGGRNFSIHLELEKVEE